MKLFSVYYVYLAAIEKKVTVHQYVQAVKLAKANPDAEFTHGLDTWWPVTGREIVQQFRRSVHDRINLRGAKENYGK